LSLNYEPAPHLNSNGARPVHLIITMMKWIRNRLGQARGGAGSGEVMEVVDARSGKALGALLQDRKTGAWVVAVAPRSSPAP
jgi:hypothetical protein